MGASIFGVLNLVINGIPSIQGCQNTKVKTELRFKPCYKWNTFNTNMQVNLVAYQAGVLNLVINGIPSILVSSKGKQAESLKF